MKRLLLLCFMFSFLNAQEEQYRIGVGAKTGSDGYGLNSRIWYNNILGASIHISNAWDNETEGGELYLNYKLSHEQKIQQYILIGGGFYRVNLDDIINVKENVNVYSLSAGLGGEVLLGSLNNHGFSIEAAYTYGMVEYSGATRTEIGEDIQSSGVKSKELTPYSAKVLYHYYFTSHKKKEDIDNDKDGVNNQDDKCPEVAEDLDGFEDMDGCPDIDNDKDGIQDMDDRCPLKPEDVDGLEDTDGCPDPDNDGDEILDLQDKCPLKAEDKDNFEDTDGCPDPDNDKDGIEDTKDSCPNIAETFNNFEDTDGCPDIVPVADTVVQKAIADIPVSKIGFESGNDVLLPQSFEALDAMAKLLTQYPSIKIEVQGHTDNTGSPEKNKILSQRRAESVVKYLVSKNIAETRIKAIGHGDEKPVADNSTAEGRALNRRVEIISIQ